MAMGSIRRFDVQAKWSMFFSLASVVTCLGMFALLARNWDGQVNLVKFRHGGAFQLIYLAFTGLTMVLSAFGLSLGFNSAGQRRNDRQKLSWTAFFVGVSVLAFAIILLAAFWLLKQPIRV